MKGIVIASLSVLALACATDDRQQTAASSPHRGDSTSRLALRADVRRACAQAAAALVAAGARQIADADTVLNANQYHPRQLGCLIWADSFATAPATDLFKAGPSATDWTWHPFEGVRDSTFAIEKDSVQCEATPFSAASRGISLPGRDRRFRVFCHPD